MKKCILAVLLMCNLLSVANGQSLPNEGSENRATADGKFVVHEWGTFTTFSGSDGVFLDFRPLADQHADLPNYVRDRGSYSNNFSRLLGKIRLWGKVRMETPVTYFYTDRARTIDVQVDFPQGLLTEFYPPVSSFEPPIDDANIFTQGELIGKSNLAWKQIDIIPASEFIPNIANPNLKRTLQESICRSLVPHALNEQHYAAARETDSAIVHMREAKSDQSHFEKFLFYRGVGKFELPIKAIFQDEGIRLVNRGSHPLKSIVQIEVQDQIIKATKLAELASGETHQIGPRQEMTVAELSELVERSLIEEGLYEKEASAMVATWQQSWFLENGTRVLYMVPTNVTESLLPLRVTPAPHETVRVLVGRLEIMSPESERAMLEAVAQSAKQRLEYLETSSGGKQLANYPIPDAIRNFGRMAEPALIRIAKITQDKSVQREAEMLIAEFQQHK